MEILRCRRSLVVVAGMNKPNDHAEPTKSNAKNIKNKINVYTCMKTNASL